MALHTFGWTDNAVTADRAGNVKGGVEVRAYADWDKTQPVTDLFDHDGVTPIPGGVVVSDSEGRFGARASDAYSLLYFFAGVSPKPYVLAAHEALDAGTASHAQAVAAAEAAQAEAEAAKVEAVNAAALVNAPADTQMKALLDNPNSQSRASLNATYARPHGNKAIILGDSIALGSDDPNFHAYGASWFSRLCAASGQRLRFYRNAGVGGNTSTQMLARIKTDVIDKRPDICVLEAITPNDPAGSVPAATTKANITSMVDQLVAAGIRPILVTGPPSDTTSRRDAMNALSVWLVGFANSRGIAVLDIYAPLSDPADGTYLAAYTSDGVHPTTAGQQAVAAYLSSRLPQDLYAMPVLTAAKADTANLITNGVFVGDGNADGVADNWTAVGGGITAKSLVAAERGNWQQVTCNGTLGYLTQGIGSGWAVGDTLALGAKFENPSGVAVTIQVNFTNGTPYNSFKAVTTTTDTSGTAYFEVPVPAGTTAVEVRMIVNTTAGDVRFGQMTLRNLTAQGAA